MTLTIEDRLARIESALPIPQNVGIAFIAGKMGVSDSYLRNRRFLLPNYGISEMPGKALWSMSLVSSWLEVSAVERERSWIMKSSSERKKIMECWKK